MTTDFPSRLVTPATDDTEELDVTHVGLPHHSWSQACRACSNTRWR